MKSLQDRHFNALCGIDPQMVVRDQDRTEIEAKYQTEDGNWNRCTPEFRPPRRMQILATVPMAVVFMAGLIGVAALRWPIWTMGLAGIGAVACQIGGYSWIWRKHTQMLVRKELCLRGYEICVHCGYWLRGLPGANNCPECGTPVTIQKP